MPSALVGHSVAEEVSERERSDSSQQSDAIGRKGSERGQGSERIGGEPRRVLGELERPVACSGALHDLLTAVYLGKWRYGIELELEPVVSNQGAHHFRAADCGLSCGATEATLSTSVSAWRGVRAHTPNPDPNPAPGARPPPSPSLSSASDNDHTIEECASSECGR